MSAELREAAALIRERAGLVPPSPWFLYESDDGHGSQISADREHFNVIAQPAIADRGRFLFLWQPDAALAVAGWLEATADSADENLFEESPEGPCCAEPAACRGHGLVWACERCGECIGAGCSCWSDALHVARTFLGTDGESR